MWIRERWEVHVGRGTGEEGLAASERDGRPWCFKATKRLADRKSEEKQEKKGKGKRKRLTLKRERKKRGRREQPGVGQAEAKQAVLAEFESAPCSASPRHADPSPVFSFLTTIFLARCGRPFSLSPFSPLTPYIYGISSAALSLSGQHWCCPRLSSRFLSRPPK